MIYIFVMFKESIVLNFRVKREFLKVKLNMIILRKYVKKDIEIY